VTRRTTRTVECGPVKFGSEHPLVRQTMATTLTSDVEGTIEQVIACADEGFDLVRVTVVGMKDAKACMKIREGLDARGYNTPLCADMHFAPKVALAVADAVEKVRINPGNFVDGRKTFDEARARRRTWMRSPSHAARRTPHAALTPFARAACCREPPTGSHLHLHTSTTDLLTD
jgi:4-hydroxy-3-methylbut-2-en-1-yl diphosphate synthase IspG/GcpE